VVLDTALLVLSEEMDEDAMEPVAADVTVVPTVLPEVVNGVDSPVFDVALVGEALSTLLQKIRMQAKTAMPWLCDKRAAAIYMGHWGKRLFK
jgi:hypothetical protein